MSRFVIFSAILIGLLGCSMPTSTSSEGQPRSTVDTAEWIKTADTYGVGSDPKHATEVEAKLDPDCFIVGIGGTITRGNFVTWKIAYRKIRSDGTLSDIFFIYDGKKSSGPIENYTAVPSGMNAAITGFTLSNHNNDLAPVKIRYRLWDSTNRKLHGSTLLSGSDTDWSGEVVFDTSQIPTETDYTVLTGLAATSSGPRITTAKVTVGTLNH